MDDTVIRDLPEGMRPAGLRNHNERLVLSAIQRHSELAAADLARLSGLSAQAVSVISRALEKEKLVRRGQPVKGKVGKPRIPLSLNPEGAYAFGLRLGRRRADLIVMDFEGSVRDRRQISFAYPTPAAVMAFVEGAIRDASDRLDITRIAGIGVAAPFELWNWLDVVNAPKEQMAAWRDFSFTQALGEFTDLPVFVGNDGTLTCAAELVFGRGRTLSDFAYFYVGSFVGGGVVLGGRLYPGRTGNAGAFGTLPVRNTDEPAHQLIHHASVFILEKRLHEEGLCLAGLGAKPEDWTGFDGILDAWLDECAQHLATAAVAAASVIDFEAIVIDGRFPNTIRERLTRMVADKIGSVDTRGIDPPAILPGTIGPVAGAIGAAYQPIRSTYLFSGNTYV